MNAKKLASAALLLLATLGLLGGIHSRSTSQGHAAVAAGEASAARASGAAPHGAVGERNVALGERNLALGATFTYEVDASYAVSASGNTLASSTVGGRLVLEVVGPVNGGAAVRAVLVDASRSDLGAQADASAKAALSTPFFFVLRQDGAIQSFHFSKGMSGEARRHLRAVVSAMQLTAGSAGATEWQASEGDASGQIVAHYVRSGDRLEKTTLRYDLIRTPRGLVTPQSIGTTFEARGTTTMTVDASGWPSSVAEDTVVAAAFAGGRMETASKAHARLVASGVDRSHAGSFEAAAESFDPDVDAMAESVALARRNADVSLVGNATYAELASKLGTDGSERNLTVVKMGALFKVRPESVDQARAALLSAGTSAETAGALAAALGNAGTPSAQRALADTIHAKGVSEETKIAAAMSLGSVEEPTADAHAALSTAMSSSNEDVAGVATLAMGSVLRADGEHGADTSNGIDSLLHKLSAATTAGDKTLILDALGNSGDPRAEEAVIAHVGAADPGVRSAAFGALRFMKSDRAAQVLSIGAQDVEPLVRQTAVSAMTERDAAPLLPILAKVLSSDTEPSVRLVAVRVLAGAINTTPEAEQLLLQTSSKDPDAKVRTAATQALSRPVAR